MRFFHVDSVCVSVCLVIHVMAFLSQVVEYKLSLRQLTLDIDLVFEYLAKEHQHEVFGEYRLQIWLLQIFLQEKNGKCIRHPSAGIQL